MTLEELERITDFHQLGPLAIYLLSAPTDSRGFGYSLPEERQQTKRSEFGPHGTSRQDVTR